MLKQTENHKELTTSMEMEEGNQEKMIRKTTGTVRQGHKEESSVHVT